MANVTEIMQMCRLCLVKEEVNVPIFEGAGDIRQILEKIKRCLPVKVDLGDNLPKKICEGCVYKLDLCYQFYNKASQSEKQLLTWLTATDDVSVDSKARIPAAIEEIVVSPTQIVKEEPITESYENQFNNFYEGTNYRDAPETITASELSLGENEEPPVKKRKKTAAYASSSAVTDSDEDADDPIDTTITKTEDESDEEEDDENEDLDSTEAEPAFVDVSQEASTDVQPGPSGIQKPGDSQFLRYTCNVCSKKFQYKYLLKKHRWSHEEKVLPCPNCLKTYSNSLSLERHVTECMANPKKCNICNEEFAVAVELKAHVTKVHKDCNFKCDFCDKAFKFKCILKKHLDHRHPECKDCGVSFKSKRDLVKHMKAAGHGPGTEFTCDRCGKGYATAASLREHYRVHNPLRDFKQPHQCNRCGKGFHRRNLLEKHMKLHDQGVEFACDKCDMIFVTAREVTLHSSIHLTEEKKFVCNFCGKGFSKNESYVVHVRQHTGDRPFECTGCDNAYSSRRGLMQHLKNACISKFK